MKKVQNDKNQKKIQQAVYKFHLSEEQLRDLQTSFDIFDKSFPKESAIIWKCEIVHSIVF